MIRGAIVWVNLADTAPPEMGKTRPGLIISNTQQNQVLDTVVIIPLSTRPPEIWPLRLRFRTRPRNKESFAIVPALRQVSKGRLLNVIGRAPEEFMVSLEEAVAAYLGE